MISLHFSKYLYPLHALVSDAVVETKRTAFYFKKKKSSPVARQQTVPKRINFGF